MLQAPADLFVERYLHFLGRKTSLRLVSDILDSNRNWKNKYFFVEGTDWVCRPEEWDSKLDGFDNTWGIARESGVSFVFIFTILNAFVMHLTSPFSVFNPSSSTK